MGLLNRLMGGKGKSKADWGEFKKSRIAKEKWIKNYFLIPFFKPEDMSEDEFQGYQERLSDEILGLVLKEMESEDSEKRGHRIAKKATVRPFHKGGNEYCILISFKDIKESDYGTQEIIYKVNYLDELGEYGFSPLEELDGEKTLKNIESQLRAIHNEKPGKNLIYFDFGDNGRPTITETDGLRFLTYPFEKRVQLHLTHLEVEKHLFGKNLDRDVIEHLSVQKDESEHLKRCFIEIQKILLEYNLFQD